MFGPRELKPRPENFNRESVMADLEYLLYIHRKELDGQVDYVAKETAQENSKVFTKPLTDHQLDVQIEISRPSTSWSGYNIRENVRNYFYPKKATLSKDLSHIDTEKTNDKCEANGQEEDNIDGEGNNDNNVEDNDKIVDNDKSEVRSLEMEDNIRKVTENTIEGTRQDRVTDSEIRDKYDLQNNTKGSHIKPSTESSTMDKLANPIVTNHSNGRITLTTPYSVFQVPCTRLAILTTLQSYAFLYKLEQLKPKGGQLYSRWKLWEEEYTIDQKSPSTENSIRSHKATTSINTQIQLQSALTSLKTKMGSRRVCDNVSICREGVLPNRSAANMKSGGTITFQMPFEVALDFLGQTATMVLTESINPPHDIQGVPICGIQHKAKLRYSLILLWLQELPQDMSFINYLPEIITTKLSNDLKQYTSTAIFSLNSSRSEEN